MWSGYIQGQRWEAEMAGGEGVSVPWRWVVKDMDDALYYMSDSDDCTSEILHTWVASLALTIM